MFAYMPLHRLPKMFANPALQKKYIPDVLWGKRFLAVFLLVVLGRNQHKTVNG